MMRKIGFPVLALCGIAFAIFMIYYGTRTPPASAILFAPPASPYKNYVAGEGIIEAAHKNIAVGVPFAEIIEKIYVQVGDFVKKGDRLFKLDTRRLEAARAQALADIKTAHTDYENQKVQFAFYEKLKNKDAVSQQEYKTAFYARELAQKRFESAKAALKVIETDMNRSLLRAPVDGQVLQVNSAVGEVANTNPFDKSAVMLFGPTDIYHLRIDIDEEDAWRVISGAPATAFVRGNSKIVIPLTFVYLEPYIIPKVALSGASTERVDTRVLQVVYSFARGQHPVYSGQLLDVFIEAKSREVHS